jgi:hypothetical protein
MLYIFDLDGTAIDSTHRQNTFPDGSLNLAKWKENNTPKKIRQDSLLPLGQQWATGLLWGKVAIITARVFQEADYTFLKNHNLNYDFIYSRRDGDNMPDASLKRLALYRLARDMNKSVKWLAKFATFYDDNLSVLKMADSLGISTVNATAYNDLQTKRLAK